MGAFLLLDLAPATLTYQQPLIAQVQQTLPGVATLDLDARSDELLLHYALKLLRETAQVVVLVKTTGATQDFGNAMPLIEELLQEREGRYILLLGEHPRLHRMLQARPQIVYKQVSEEAEVLAAIRSYFSPPDYRQV